MLLRVIISVNNAEKYFAERIKSCLKQDAAFNSCSSNMEIQ